MAEAWVETDYAVTWLRMDARPSQPRPPAPASAGLSLQRVTDAPAGYMRHLYDAVGAAYHWTDMHGWSDAEVEAFAGDPAMGLYVLGLTGWPAGFFMLDRRGGAACDLAYFGLVPQAVGRGLGGYLLGTAVHMGWDDGCAALTVNTCTLDHPRALPLYQSWGFTPERRETRRARLPR